MKIGILTYHYSNNYGGVLQSYALYQTLQDLGFKSEVINFVPSSYKNHSILYGSGLRKNVFKMNKDDLNPKILLKRLCTKSKYNENIIEKFDSFRSKHMKMSRKVSEKDLDDIINGYDTIIVGSDQVWHPDQRNRSEYFLGFPDYSGKRVSYAADSTVAAVEKQHIPKLAKELSEFDFISVRNKHTFDFVNTIIKKKSPIVVDPTLLVDFSNFASLSESKVDDEYILVYTLGKEIAGTNRKLIEKIRDKYGGIKVYSVVIPTMKFHLCDYADEVLYNVGPFEWVNMIKNATFVLTDSFHATLFSLKFKKPFVAYYSEILRSARFADLSNRYGLEDFIISDISQLDAKKTLMKVPNFGEIGRIIDKQKLYSLDFLRESLKN
ncbi:MAG: polysaccharide pyruvyl transferase family protein [Bacteroidales bacterium]|nr:polysaccharide pyruvyl transferase family protein [Bacteroidales bacterium]